MSGPYVAYWSLLATVVCGVINNDIIAFIQQAATADKDTHWLLSLHHLFLWHPLFIIPRASNLLKQKNWF